MPLIYERFNLRVFVHEKTALKWYPTSSQLVTYALAIRQLKVNRCSFRVLFAISDAPSGRFSLVLALFWCDGESGILRDTHWK